MVCRPREGPARRVRKHAGGQEILFRGNDDAGSSASLVVIASDPNRISAGLYLQGAVFPRHSNFEPPSCTRPLAKRRRGAPARFDGARANMQADSFLEGIEDAEQLVSDALAVLYERDYAQREGKSAEAIRLTATVKRKSAALDTELNRLSASLESSSITARESRRRQDLISGLRRKAEELSGALSRGRKAPGGSVGMGSIDIQDDGDTRETEATVDLDNRSILQLQRNLMQDQDDELEELSRVVTSTKHIGLAVSEELDLHARLLDDIDEEVTRTGSRLKLAQKMALAVYKKTSNCKLVMVAILVALVLVTLVVALLKHF